MKNMENIRGIYRMTAGFPFGEPDLRKHITWCRKNNRKPNLIPIDKKLKEIRSMQDGLKKGHQYYCEDPLSFFKLWREGLLQRDIKGFELQYVNWVEGTPYYKIGEWEGVNDFGRVEGIVIASDLNGLVDDKDFTSLAVNDFDRLRVLAYKPKEEVHEKNKGRWEENLLMENEDPYISWFHKPAEFPFSSLNPLKSAPYTWISVEYSPQEIYNALKDIGIKFPELKK